ncbi:MAG: hypothetical protein LBE56_15115 [Tannerella sp.]|jgi:hypothetical protein|nr:hypothetical protein [Tannerella sp.]
MTTVIINDQIPDGFRLLKYIQLNPHFAQIVESVNDNVLLSDSEDKLVSHEEFKTHFERRLYERLGLDIKL